MARPSVKAVLVRARELLSPEENWQKGSLSNVGSHLTSINNATCWCTVGAVAKAVIDLSGDDPLTLDEQRSIQDSYDYARPYLQEAAKCVIEAINPEDRWKFETEDPTTPVYKFNDRNTFIVMADGTGRLDGTTHDDILKVLDCAIELAPDAPPE